MVRKTELKSRSISFKLRHRAYYNILFKRRRPKPFHYTRRIMPKRLTSLRCPSPRHSAKVIHC